MGVNEWLTNHLWVTYLLIFFMIAYVYNKVFRVRKLPVLKTAVVYLMIALGSVLLLIFQIDASLPIVQSLLVAIAMMVAYRLRLIFLSRRGTKETKGEDQHEA